MFDSAQQSNYSKHKEEDSTSYNTANNMNARHIDAQPGIRSNANKNESNNLRKILALIHIFQVTK